MKKIVELDNVYVVYPEDFVSTIVDENDKFENEESEEEGE